VNAVQDYYHRLGGGVARAHLQARADFVDTYNAYIKRYRAIDYADDAIRSVIGMNASRLKIPIDG